MADDNDVLVRQKLYDGMKSEISDSTVNYSITLNGYNEIKKFFEDESDFWITLGNETVPSATIQNARNLLNLSNYFKERLKEIVAIAPTNNLTPAQIEMDWHNIKIRINPEPRINSHIVYSKSSLGSYLAKRYRENRERAEASFTFFKGQIPTWNQSLTALQGAFDAYLFQEKVDASLSDRLTADIDSWERIRNIAEQAGHDIKDTHDRQRTEMDAWKGQFIKDQEEANQKLLVALGKSLEERNKQFDALVKVYKEEMTLKAPIQYWTDRAREYRTQGRIWMTGFAVATLLFVGLLILILYNLPAGFYESVWQFKPEGIKSSIVFAFILSLGVYLIRIFARMTFSSYHLLRDAEEREQLTRVYLALIKENAIEPKDREIVLQALFSRVDTGILTGDSSPTMPASAFEGLLKNINIGK